MKKVFSVDMWIYNQEHILSAIEDFSESCDIVYSTEGTLEIEAETEEEIQSVFSEFMNYVISL